MSTVALGIAPNTSNIGVTPLVHRRILGAQFANCGIIDGLNVTGRNDLRYNVGAGVAVCSTATARPSPTTREARPRPCPPETHQTRASTSSGSARTTSSNTRIPTITSP